MERHPINEKRKSRKGLGWFLIILIILGFIVSVVLISKGSLTEVIHP